MTPDIFEISPLHSLIPLVNSPSKDTPSVAKSVRIGSKMVPSAFFIAVVPTLKY